MKRIFLLLCALAVAAGAQSHTAAKAPTDAELQARIHAFLDRSIGWQALDEMKIESISRPDASGLRKVTVMLGKGDQHQEGAYLVTADGREIIEGTASPLSADPWAETRAKLDLRGAPAQGAANAPVTVVEFSDLECPYCKEEAGAIAQLMQQEPGKVRVVFKYYPLVKIHPWSMQAAVAAACVAEQSAPQFWTFEQSVFTAQDLMTPDNAVQRLREIAVQSGAKAGPYDGCVANPATKAKVEASIANGDAVGVTSTPTLFINGRTIPGAIQEAQLKQLVDHEATFGVPPPDLASGKYAGKQCGECKPLPPIKH